MSKKLGVLLLLFSGVLILFAIGRTDSYWKYDTLEWEENVVKSKYHLGEDKVPTSDMNGFEILSKFFTIRA